MFFIKKTKINVIFIIHINFRLDFFMGSKGLEPSRHGHRNLNPARLPIPPQPLMINDKKGGTSLSSIAFI